VGSWGLRRLEHIELGWTAFLEFIIHDKRSREERQHREGPWVIFDL
jgi:hypothetical protein